MSLARLSLLLPCLSLLSRLSSHALLPPTFIVTCFCLLVSRGLKVSE